MRSHAGAHRSGRKRSRPEWIPSFGHETQVPLSTLRAASGPFASVCPAFARPYL